MLCIMQAHDLSQGLTVVTGASSGIGRSLARRLALRGAPVALLARRLELLQSLQAEISGAGGRAIALECDVTSLSSVRNAIAKAEAAFGPTERLIANAGAPDTTTPESFEAARIGALLDLNVLGVARCIEVVLPGMLERDRGHLVAVSSLAGYRGLPKSGAYSGSKAALTNLMESLRMDLRGTGLDVTLLLPGFVATKPAKKKKRNRPFRLELEAATARMERSIERRKAYDAFPRSLVALQWLARALPPVLLDRVLAGRGPRTKPRPRVS